LRILWLKTELLHPVDKGGRIRTYQMLKELKREHHITYLTLDDGTAAPDAPERATEYCHELVTVPHRTRPKFSPGFYVELSGNLLSPLPYFMKKYESDAMRRAIKERVARERFDVIVCDFLMPMINVPQDLQVPVVLFQHNVEAMIWKRHFEVQTNKLKRAYLYAQWRKSAAYERKACRAADCVVAVSVDDRDLMRAEYGVERVFDIPTGVDTDFFRPGAAARDGVESVSSRGRHNLVFTGSMDWLPNEDAMQYFTAEILPRIKREVPDATLTVVGRNPYASLVELGKRDSSIEVTGRVADVRPFMERAAVYIVPLRIGGGTRLKIYEAMAMEIPMVSTTIGAEGLPIKHEAELLLADTAEAFAAAVVRLLRDDVVAKELAARAASVVRSEYGWGAVATSFTDICEQAARRVTNERSVSAKKAESVEAA
jgi:glycosyltransferase involved in cell wall biosynthesis